MDEEFEDDNNALPAAADEEEDPPSPTTPGSTASTLPGSAAGSMYVVEEEEEVTSVEDLIATTAGATSSATSTASDPSATSVHRYSRRALFERLSRTSSPEVKKGFNCGLKKPQLDKDEFFKQFSTPASPSTTEPLLPAEYAMVKVNSDNPDYLVGVSDAAGGGEDEPMIYDHADGREGGKEEEEKEEEEGDAPVASSSTQSTPVSLVRPEHLIMIESIIKGNATDATTQIIRHIAEQKEAWMKKLTRLPLARTAGAGGVGVSITIRVQLTGTAHFPLGLPDMNRMHSSTQLIASRHRSTFDQLALSVSLPPLCGVGSSAATQIGWVPKPLSTPLAKAIDTGSLDILSVQLSASPGTACKFPNAGQSTYIDIEMRVGSEADVTLLLDNILPVQLYQRVGKPSDMPMEEDNIGSVASKSASSVSTSSPSPSSDTTSGQQRRTIHSDHNAVFINNYTHKKTGTVETVEMDEDDDDDNMDVNRAASTAASVSATATASTSSSASSWR